MSMQIAVRIPDGDVALLDAAVRDGRFESRAAALREGLGRLLADEREREREIEEEYRRAYADAPEDEIWGRAGAAHLAESVSVTDSIVTAWPTATRFTRSARPT